MQWTQYTPTVPCIYEGDIDNYDVSSNMLGICSNENVSLFKFVTDATLVTQKPFGEWLIVTNKGSNLTDVSTTISYGDYSETSTINFVSLHPLSLK